MAGCWPSRRCRRCSRAALKAAARIFSSGFAAAISFFLFLSSLQYVLDLKPLGKILVYGIPVWLVQLFLPLGFGLVAVRLVWHASEKWSGRCHSARAGAALVAGMAIWVAYFTVITG